MSNSDSARKLEDARVRLPLMRLMEQHGHGPANGNWKRFPQCPFCQHKDSAGVREDGGRQYFKCFYTSCATGTQAEHGAWDEIDYLSYVTKLDRRGAFVEYLKMAGVWREQKLPPSVLPGQRARRSMPPEPPKDLEDLPRPKSESESPASPGSEPLPAESEPSQPGPVSGVDHDSSPSERLRQSQSLSSEDGGPASSSGVDNPDTGSPAASPAVPGEPANLDDAPPWEEATPVNGAGEAPPAPPENVNVNGSEVNGHDVGAGGGGGDDADGAKPPGEGPRAALKWFYERTSLTPEDEKGLWFKRGLTPETVKLFGVRSTLRSYKEVLIEAKEHFPVAVLLDAGLYKQGEKAAAEPVPNPQYYGWGMAGKAKEDKGKVKKGDMIWDWTMPLLIPYFDRSGELLFLRPHKGNPRGAVPLLFVARPRIAAEVPAPMPPEVIVDVFGDRDEPDENENRNYEYAIITEGEFKVMALWQALSDANGRCRVALACLPGITMAKPMAGDIEDWLEDCGLVTRPVVVAYDSEEKGNPALPGYTEDKKKRFDSAIWGRFLVRQLSRIGYEGQLCTLPNEWRNDKGKADWDGALSFLIAEFLAEMEGTNAKRPSDPALIWGLVKPLVWKEFMRVIHEAKRNEEMAQGSLFASEEERIIQNKLEWISYEPQLPIGGENETALSKRLHRLVKRLRRPGVERLPRKACGFLLLLAKEYQNVKGGYYTFKKLTDPMLEQWMNHLAEAAGREDVEVRRVCEVAVKGIPKRISDFFMKAHYLLRRPDDTRCRLVTVHSMFWGDSPLIEMSAESFAQPGKWREWLLHRTNGGAWAAGERELNALQQDVDRELAYRNVEEVTVRGFHEDSKLWFFSDVVYTPEGKQLHADKHGIVWYEGTGYKLAVRDGEGEQFMQGSPAMHPNRVKSLEEIKLMFCEMVNKLHDTIGDYSAHMGIGITLAAAAMREVFAKYSAFPGLWVHGEQGQGKSSVVRWLLRCWGFPNRDKGLSLQGSSNPGLSIAMQQYGSLPFWFDEYQPGGAGWLVDKLKTFFGHEQVGKKTFGEGLREIRGTHLVSGVATAGDGQLRSRYGYMLVSEANRKKNHFEWFQTASKDFFFIGRTIIERRKEFAEFMMQALESWMKMPSTAHLDERTRLVHGVGFAGFWATAALLESHTASDLGEFKNFLCRHGGESMEQVQRKVNVNLFWIDLVTALKSDAFGHNAAERRRVFMVAEDKKAVSPVSPVQLRAAGENSRYDWKSYKLYFQPEAVISMLRSFKKKQGLDVPLDRNDLLMQMRTQPYWVPAPQYGVHKQRFGGKSAETCWCIALDKHEMGYIAVSDEAFEESRRSEDGNFVPSDEWVDPRCGDLFALIHMLIKKKEGEGGDE